MENCPARYVLFRALRYTWLHIPEAESSLPLEQAKERFGLTALWDAFQRREDAFVAENRRYDDLRELYRWADIDESKMAPRRQKLLSDERAGADKPYGIGLLMGVFDLFHVGHLRLIRRAKAQCRHLRVAVLSDALVMRYKSITPTIPLSERVEILAAIREVDEVVVIEDEPSRLLEWDRRPFDCFFSGDDYRGNAYWEWERGELRTRGADIVFFPYTQEQSSTKIRKKLEGNEE